MHYKVVLKVISFQLYKGNVVVVVDDASLAYFQRVVGVGASANQLGTNSSHLKRVLHGYGERAGCP